MVWNVAIDGVEDAPRPIVAVGNEYANGKVLAPHRHRRSQLLYGASGVVVVTTSRGSWVMPPERGMWIPSGTEHEVRMLGQVRTQSLYLETDATSGMPGQCAVLGVSAFMRSLLAEAIELPANYDLKGRAGALMELLQCEMRRLPVLPLSLPFPADVRLAQVCREFLGRPTVHDTIESWSDTLGMSRRNFTRFFRTQTGLSFVAWRQQACLVAALPRLAAGEPVTAVAVDLCYNNPAAFTAMFKRMLGESPRAYFKHVR